MRTAKPHKTYEGLLIQFLAMQRVCASLEKQLYFFQEKAKKLSPERIEQLEKEIESQREMNAILTAELERYANP